MCRYGVEVERQGGRKAGRQGGREVERQEGRKAGRQRGRKVAYRAWRRAESVTLIFSLYIVIRASCLSI